MICRLCNARVAPADGAVHRATCPGGTDFYAIAEELYESIGFVSGSDDISTMQAILRERFGPRATPNDSVPEPSDTQRGTP